MAEGCCKKDCKKVEILIVCLNFSYKFVNPINPIGFMNIKINNKYKLLENVGYEEVKR